MTSMFFFYPFPVWHALEVFCARMVVMVHMIGLHCRGHEILVDLSQTFLIFWWKINYILLIWQAHQSQELTDQLQKVNNIFSLCLLECPFIPVSILFWSAEYSLPAWSFMNCFLFPTGTKRIRAEIFKRAGSHAGTITGEIQTKSF